MEIETFFKSQDSSATEFSNALLVVKRQSEAGRSDGSFNFFIRKFWFLYLNIDLFASLRKKTNSSIAVHYRLSLIGYGFQHLFCSLKDIIASVNSLCEVRIFDVAVLRENAHLKHFVFGDTTGTRESFPRSLPLPSWPFRPPIFLSGRAAITRATRTRTFNCALRTRLSQLLCKSVRPKNLFHKSAFLDQPDCCLHYRERHLLLRAQVLFS